MIERSNVIDGSDIKTPSADKRISLDASCVETNMTRPYGRAYEGRRCHDMIEDSRWKAKTVLSSIRIDRDTDTIVFSEGSDQKRLGTSHP